MGKQLQMFGADWTKRKLNILTKYLAAYNTALKNKPFTRVYVDAFAGTGYRELRQREYHMPHLFEDVMQEDAQRFLKGSATRALEVKPGFHRYLFIEIDSAKAAELEKLKVKYPNQADRIQVVCDDANKAVADYCARENWRSVRAVMFLDPFATQVRWATIQKVAATKAVDLWYLFPLMAVNRLLARNPTKACRDRLDEILGGREWLPAFYGHRRRGFFPDPEGGVAKACNMQGIGDYFRSLLAGVFAGVASTRCVLENRRGSPLFQLFFAVGNPKPQAKDLALRIAEHLLKKM